MWWLVPPVQSTISILSKVAVLDPKTKKKKSRVVTLALSSRLAAGINWGCHLGGGNFNFYSGPFLTQKIMMARSSIGQPHVLQSSLPIQPATTKSRGALPRSVRLGADYGPKCACPPNFCNGIRMGARAVGGKEKDWPPGFEQQLQNRKGRPSLQVFAGGNAEKESTNGVLRRVEEKVETVSSTVDSSNANSSSASQILSFLCPLLKLLGGGDPSAPRNTFLETATTGFASLARLPWGSQVLPETAAVRAATGQPPKLFRIYEFEACPFCRRVREALTELDLSAEIYPCPKGSLRHREFVRITGGKDQFPFFLDPNTGVSLYESSDIVKYLFKEYGAGRQPSPGLLESTLVTGWVPTLVRAGRGMMLFPRATTQPPDTLLVLYSYENNQFARLVREALCELELPYILRNAGKGSSLRPKLLEIAGSTQVPYLVDPNTGVSMAESKDIIAYLFKTYGASSSKPVAA